MSKVVILCARKPEASPLFFRSLIIGPCTYQEGESLLFALSHELRSSCILASGKTHEECFYTHKEVHAWKTQGASKQSKPTQPRSQVPRGQHLTSKLISRSSKRSLSTLLQHARSRWHAPGHDACLATARRTAGAFREGCQRIHAGALHAGTRTRQHG